MKGGPMSDPIKYLPESHWSKIIFVHNNYPISAVAKYIDRSYTYTSNLLAGHSRITPEIESRLKKLCEKLEGKEKI
jgi:hypothetical protein